MKATLPVYLAIARLRWVGTPACRTAARPADASQSGSWRDLCACPFSAAMCGLDHICGICREIIC